MTFIFQANLSNSLFIHLNFFYLIVNYELFQYLIYLVILYLKVMKYIEFRYFKYKLLIIIVIIEFEVRSQVFAHL